MAALLQGGQARVSAHLRGQTRCHHCTRRPTAPQPLRLPLLQCREGERRVALMGSHWHSPRGLRQGKARGAARDCDPAPRPPGLAPSSHSWLWILRRYCNIRTVWNVTLTQVYLSLSPPAAAPHRPLTNLGFFSKKKQPHFGRGCRVMTKTCRHSGLGRVARRYEGEASEGARRGARQTRACSPRVALDANRAHRC